MSSEHKERPTSGQVGQRLESKPKKKETVKDVKDEKPKKKSKLNFEEKKGTGKLSSPKVSSVTKVAASGREVLRRRYQYERIKDSDDNSGIQAADASREMSVNTLRGAGHRLKQGRKSRNDKMVSSRSHVRNNQGKQKLSFKKSSSDKKPNQGNAGLSRKYQKKNIKRAYYKKSFGGTYTKNAEKALKGIGKKLKQAIGAMVKKVGAYAIGIVLALMMLVTSVSAFAGLLSNAVSVIISTSYQSDDYEITATENVYNRLEADLKFAIESVESDHSGYDEYRYDVDVIGHDPQILMAYLTARFGEFTTGSVSRELSRVFDDQYTYSLTRSTQTRTRIVTRYFRDPITSEWTSETYEDTYDWDILKVRLTANDLATVLLARMNSEERELYHQLMETKGNFPGLPSPLRESWRSSVTSMYGYRLDPFDGHVEFHTGIDIARPVGTELVAVFNGVVSDAGYSSGYGNFLELINEKGQSVFYAHCNSIDVAIGDNVLAGQKIAEMGSSGNSTGSHLHFEIKDANGVRLNPYFYLSDEIATDPN